MLTINMQVSLIQLNLFSLVFHDTIELSDGSLSIIVFWSADSWSHTSIILIPMGDLLVIYGVIYLNFSRFSFLFDAASHQIEARLHTSCSVEQQVT